MTTFFYKISFRIGCNKVCNFWNRIVGWILNIFYPIYCNITSGEIGIATENRKNKIIVSLTSFPDRIDSIHLCIESLMRQSVKPDSIILWLSTEEFKQDDIPEKILKLKERGLEIKFCDDDLKPHKKLYYTALNYKNSIIITVDDDVLYSGDLIEKLVKAYKKNGNNIYCNMAHEITFDNNYNVNLYDDWNGGAIGIDGANDRLVAIGVGGILYPPNCFDEEYYNKENIKELALYTDDLWLKFTELRTKYSVFKVNKYSKNPITISSSQKVALTKVNNGEGRNDISMKKLNEYYNVNWNEIKS